MQGRLARPRNDEERHSAREKNGALRGACSGVVEVVSEPSASGLRGALGSLLGVAATGHRRAGHVNGGDNIGDITDGAGAHTARQYPTRGGSSQLTVCDEADTAIAA